MDRELLTKEAYLKKLSRRSSNTARGHKTSINTFENWFKTTDLIIANEPLKILGSFVDFLESQGKKARTINTYLNQLKKYFRLCHGIKLDPEDEALVNQIVQNTFNTAQFLEILHVDVQEEKNFMQYYLRCNEINSERKNCSNILQFILTQDKLIVLLYHYTND
jgi:site-specific recombinase XerD